MAKIQVKNIRKDYKEGQVQALRGVSFECPDGKFFCLLGPAGAGKSTTIKLIGGVEAVDDGQILFDEQDVTDVMPMERDVAIAFETYALYPQRTVRENLAFPLQAPYRKAEWPAEKVSKRVDEIAHLLGIHELLDRFPRQLSGGQRQRVALGRALVRKPRAYLLDEPIAHLDAKLRHRMRGELKRIQMELGITTIYTTPDQLEALSLADEMAVLNQGQIEQIGTPDDIYKHPRNVFVARFVGDPPMNILSAHLVEEGLQLENMGLLPTPSDLHQKLASNMSGSGVLVGVRPKDIRILSPDSSDVQASGEVRNTQVMGETLIATLTVDSHEIRVKMGSDAAPHQGERVGFSFQASDCHFFDPGTQNRIQGL